MILIISKIKKEVWADLWNDGKILFCNVHNTGSAAAPANDDDADDESIVYFIFLYGKPGLHCYVHVVVFFIGVIIFEPVESFELNILFIITFHWTESML
jgi:hypothetical protein